MTTNATTAEDRLAKLGIHLPDAPTPFGAYVPAVQTGNLLFLSGMLATSGHTATALGVVGKDLDVKAGREAAYTAALNVLALTKKQLGSLNRVSHVVRLGVYVAATSEFTEHPMVADAASELLQDVFGEETVSSRLVFGAASLPLGSPVELGHLGSVAVIKSATRNFPEGTKMSNKTTALLPPRVNDISRLTSRRPEAYRPG